MAGTRCYWDGRSWTEHVAPADQSVPAAGAGEEKTRKPASPLIVVALVCALLLPFGIYLTVERQDRNKALCKANAESVARLTQEPVDYSRC